MLLKMKKLLKNGIARLSSTTRNLGEVVGRSHTTVRKILVKKLKMRPYKILT